MSDAPFHPLQSGLESSSERGPAAELELLNDVVLTLRKRDRVIEAKRTERRRPDQTDTDRGADEIGIVEHHSAVAANTIDEAVDFTCGGPLGRPLIVPKRSGIGINRALETNFLGQEPERHLQFGRRTPILGAAERIA